MVICCLCLLRRVYKIGGNYPALTWSRDWPWMSLVAAFRSPTRPRPQQFRPSCHCIAKSRIQMSSWTGKIYTRPGIFSEGNLHARSKHTHNVVLLSTQRLLICRQLVIPPGNQDNRFEKENIFTIPNLLSVSRIALSPVLGYLVLVESYMLALGLFSLAGVSDLVDGYIARRFPGQSSMLGSVLDPLADKCLTSVLFITLSMMGLIPVPLTVLILARDGVLVGGSFYLRYATLPPPRTWSRYWDIQRATVQFTPSILSKVNTLLQLTLVGLSLGAPVVGMTGHPTLQLLWYVTGITTLVSGVTYMASLEGFRVLKHVQGHDRSSKREPP